MSPKPGSDSMANTSNDLNTLYDQEQRELIRSHIDQILQINIDLTKERQGLNSRKKDALRDAATDGLSNTVLRLMVDSLSPEELEKAPEIWRLMAHYIIASGILPPEELEPLGLEKAGFYIENVKHGPAKEEEETKEPIEEEARFWGLINKLEIVLYAIAGSIVLVAILFALVRW